MLEIRNLLSLMIKMDGVTVHCAPAVNNARSQEASCQFDGNVSLLVPELHTHQAQYTYRPLPVAHVYNKTLHLRYIYVFLDYR